MTALAVGPIMDKTGPYVTLGVLYFAGSALLLLLGFSLTGSAGFLLLACFLSGSCVFGGQMSVIALASLFYSADLRSVGIGWALAVGRAGVFWGRW